MNKKSKYCRKAQEAVVEVTKYTHKMTFNKLSCTIILLSYLLTVVNQKIQQAVNYFQ